jgi:RimJ/RimL family protein N-acetyltransferase
VSAHAAERQNSRGGRDPTVAPVTAPGPSVRLRAVVPSDLPALFAFQADPEGCAMAAVHARGPEAFRSIWERIFRDERAVARAVLADEALAGSISCFTADGEDYVGYWIAREQWGRGIATRALRLLLAEVAYRPLLARVATHNIGSLRVLQRCGFEEIARRWSPGTERFIECEEAVLRLS